MSWCNRNRRANLTQLACFLLTMIFQNGKNEKLYSYKKLSFTNLSKPLVIFVYKTMKNIGLNPRMSRNKDVWLDSINDMKKYFKIIGSHNQKHLNRYLK